LPELTAALVQVVPLEVSTLPAVPGATNKGDDVPLPRMTLLAVRVANPVPPWATVTAAACLISLPVAPLKAAKFPSVALAGPTTSPTAVALVAIFTKSEPFHAAKHFSPDTMVTPVVGPAPRRTMEPVPALMTM
jgi:hypothetical protein